MEVLSENEIMTVSGGYSMFEISMSTTIWGGLASIWFKNPSWLFAGLISGIVLSATKVADQYYGYEEEFELIRPKSDCEPCGVA